MFHTNSRVRSMFTTVSLSRPSKCELTDAITYGGSNVALLNWLNGARFGTPSAPSVESQPIGRGTTHDLNGSNGSP
jgi:hypothetical protein